MKWLSHSALETTEIAAGWSRTLEPDAIICFFGDLGSGKTTFIKGIVQGRGGDPFQVSSPTFVYLNIYTAPIPIYHFDLYRLKNEEAFMSMGFDEYLFSAGIKCIEWSERIDKILPPQAIKLTFKSLSEEVREITHG